MRLLAVILLACFLMAGCGGTSEPSATHPARPKSPPAAPAKGPVVLGSKNFVTWGGSGFGMPHPDQARRRQRPVRPDHAHPLARLGPATGMGVGRYVAPRIGHGGSYYRKTLRVDLRLSGIGRCRPNGPRTYMALKVRVPLQPGQRPSWYEVDGSHGLCSYP